MPEQRIPDVTVRANEYLPDPDIRVSHNEWYAASWKMDFVKQIDKHETSKIANNNKQAVTQEIENMNDEKTGQTEIENQSEDTKDVTPSSPDFSSLTTDVGDNPHSPPSIESPPNSSPPIHPNSQPTVIGYNPRKTAKYNLRTNPKPNTNPDFRRLDAMTTTH